MNILNGCVDPIFSEKAKTISGIPSFVEQKYHSDIPPEKMMQVTKKLEGSTFNEFKSWLINEDPRLSKYLFDDSRHNLPYLFQDISFNKVLDIGCGYGAVSMGLSELFKSVYSLDITFEKLLFLKEFAKKKKIKNIHPVHGNALTPPFKKKSFDGVVVSGVLEWVPLFNEGPPEKVQKQFLTNINSLLVDGGQLLVGIENRIGAQYFAGWKDHNMLWGPNLMPRWLADKYSRLRKKKPYRTYTYTMRGYKNLFKKAGFSDIQFYSPLPSYRYPKYVLPFDKSVWKFFLKSVLMYSGIKGFVVKKILPYFPKILFESFSPHFLILARR